MRDALTLPETGYLNTAGNPTNREREFYES